MSAQRFPLAWPTGWKRTPSHQRKRAPFHEHRPVPSSLNPGQWYRRKSELTVAGAIARVADEMRRLGVRPQAWLISSNVRVRLDGLPYSNDREPEDAGVAVYFKRGKQDLVLACDSWNRVAGNLAAIAGHIEALRTIERYGVGSLEQAFTGYQALPAKGTTWRTTLGFAPDQVVTAADVDAAFKARARESHPDVDGGSHDAMASLTAARAEALEALTR
jgi:hypothetical protein